MNKMIRRVSVILAGALMAVSASAHHSAVAFDFGKNVSYTGVVKAFTAINPHMRLVIDVKNADGKGSVQEVKFEGHSLNNMYRAGYRKGMVKVGDTVTVSCAPYKDGTVGGYVIAVEKPNGEFFGMKSRAGATQQQIGEEVRKQAEGK
jgi:hypothetical protein